MNEREKDLHAEDLADLARRLERALEAGAPQARSEKALFVAGVGARTRRSSWSAALIPATAVVAVLIALGVVSRGALPGQALYPFRQALDRVGLAPSTAGEVRALLDEAGRLVTSAEGAATSSPSRARALAIDALATLRQADRLVGEIDGERADELEREIEALEDRADEAEDLADDTLDEREEAEEEVEERDDSSGSGSGGAGDSSGPGSGGESEGDHDDSSGSGSGGDDGDSSGSGSGGDDDSSGSGSGDDDSSGSGSGGDDDSSGKG